LRCLTILIPALNEEEIIAATVGEVLAVAKQSLDEFEVIVINDGSTDRTGAIINLLAEKHPEVSPVHNSECRGVGWAFWEGVRRAKHVRLTLIPGDRAYNIDGIQRLIQALDSAELVIGFRTNQAATRQRRRAILSAVYQRLIGWIFGFRLKDYHGIIIYPVIALRGLGLRTAGYTYQLEILVRLLRQGVGYVELPVTLNPAGRGSSRALRLRTLFDLIAALWRLRR